MNEYHIDYETYSEADLRKVGAYRYAADPSTELLIYAIRKNDGPVFVSDSLDSFGENFKAYQLLAEAVYEDDVVIYAHNAQFEAAISKYILQRSFPALRAPALNKWRCTAAMCRRAAIPSSLEKAGEFLGIEHEKDKAGAALIKKFSKPRKPTLKNPATRIYPQDEPIEFKKFGEYCRKDVLAESDIHERLKAFELKDDTLASFLFDMKMNDLGVPVNVDALEQTQHMIEQYTEALSEQFKDITGLTPSQTALVLNWLRQRGYPFPNLQAANIDTVLKNGADGWSCRYVEHERSEEGAAWLLKNPGKSLPIQYTKQTLQPVNMDPEAFDALKIRSLVSYAAVKKIKTMMNAACPDGRVRGSLMWSGAERTHRWAGRIIQPQNFKRPTFKGTEEAYGLLCEGAGSEELELLYAPFLEVVASSIRHFIQLPKGQQMIQADFSSVEARGAAWLCGEEKKLEMFRNDEPIYEAMAAKIFGVPIEQVIAEHKSGDSEKRFIGKQAELGCGYNMGRPKFRGTCEQYNYRPSQKMIDAFKPKFKKQLAKMKKLAAESEPWDEWAMKLPSYKWARPRNKYVSKQFEERQFSVFAYRESGHARKIVDPDNPTPEEWYDLTYDDLANKAVSAWRNDNPNIVQAWKDLDTAAKQAIQNPGKIFQGTNKISFGVTKKVGFKALIMKLPSGHVLVYPKPRLVWKGEKGKKDPNDYFNIGIQFWGKRTGVVAWGWVDTYGGKLLENATQALCGDLMAYGACNASNNGYNIFMLVHDEAIAEHHEGQSQEELCELLCELPEWAEGMPLAADGNIIPFYKKT